MMTATESSPGCVLVLFDASPGSQVALDRARPLAARLGRTLKVLFVEDDNWLRGSRFAFSAEVGAASGRISRLDPEQAEARLDCQRRRVEMALSVQAMTTGLDVQRGSLAVALQRLEQPVDIAIAGLVGYGGGLGRRLGRSAWALASGSTRQVLLAAAGAGRTGPVVALIEQPASLETVLESGILSAEAADARLDVLVSGGAELAAQAGRWLGQRLPKPDAWRLTTLACSDWPTLCAELKRRSARELVLSRRGDVMRDAPTKTLPGDLSLWVVT